LLVLFLSAERISTGAMSGISRLKTGVLSLEKCIHSSIPEELKSSTQVTKIWQKQTNGEALIKEN